MRGYKNFEANPHPGSLRHLVEIGYTENAVNENGFLEPTDHVLCKAWAASRTRATSTTAAQTS